MDWRNAGNKVIDWKQREGIMFSKIYTNLMEHGVYTQICNVIGFEGLDVIKSIFKEYIGGTAIRADIRELLKSYIYTFFGVGDIARVMLIFDTNVENPNLRYTTDGGNATNRVFDWKQMEGILFSKIGTDLIEHKVYIKICNVIEFEGLDVIKNMFEEYIGGTAIRAEVRELLKIYIYTFFGVGDIAKVMLIFDTSVENLNLRLEYLDKICVNLRKATQSNDVVIAFIRFQKWILFSKIGIYLMEHKVYIEICNVVEFEGLDVIKNMFEEYIGGTATRAKVRELLKSYIYTFFGGGDIARVMLIFDTSVENLSLRLEYLDRICVSLQKVTQCNDVVMKVIQSVRNHRIT
ncbi:hypothetical protein LWI29_019976 [Acer saccharum]|uniref:Uncharacterized protein n=1 Tax=Acer saccharum TaxID=4024 RepID=A0AA39T2X5_ACESA|nr:hypothetical protein LWI29_019976 [Acer saccharum]